jgi:hypothetical protein
MIIAIHETFGLPIAEIKELSKWAGMSQNSM